MEERTVILGLRALVQPVETSLTVFGLPLAPAYARTNNPLLGAENPEDIVVEASADTDARLSLALGQAALASCFSIRVERRTRRMILRCAAQPN